jgi:hypothetical protein
MFVALTAFALLMILVRLGLSLQGNLIDPFALPKHDRRIPGLPVPRLNRKFGSGELGRKST